MVSTKPSLDYYDILGVPTNAAQDDIAAAYRARIIGVRDVAGSGEQTRQLNLAYRALSNPDRRRSYDEALGVRTADPLPQAGVAGADEEAFQEPAPQHDGWHDAGVQDDYVDDEPPPRRRRGPALLLIAGLAIALLLVGAWATGMFQSDQPVQVAGADQDDGTTPANDGAEARPSSPLGELAEAIGALAPGQQRPDEGTLAEAEGTTTTSGTTAVPQEQATNGTEPAAQQTGEEGGDAPTPAEGGEPATAEPEAAATEEEPAPAAPAGEPAPAPVEPTRPAPAPRAPPLSLSSGPRLLSGGLSNSDNQGGRFTGTVGVRLLVGANGRAQGCRVTRSSGNGALDATTCRLLQQRLYFAPARDGSGNAISSVVESTHVWGSRRRR